MSKNVKECSSTFWCDEYGNPYRIMIELTGENNTELIFLDCCGAQEDNSYGREK